MARTRLAGERTRVVVLGGGFGGAYAAQTLCKKGREIDVVLLDRNNYILFYPLLVEAGVGAIEGRHVVVPIRQFIPGGEFKMAEIVGADLERQQVRYRVVGCDEVETIQYDHLVFALGSVTKIPPIPGLKEHGFQLKSLVDALELRDRGIRLLELANTVEDPEYKRALLRFVIVGANYSGVELAGEYEQFLKDAAKAYSHIKPEDIHVMLLEYTDRILPATSENLAKWAHDRLTQRGVDIRTKFTIKEVGDNYAVLSNDERIGTHTVVWTAGIAPSPLIKAMGLPANRFGYIECERDLRVKGYDNVWAVGDSATVLDDDGKPYAPTAQNASRQGPLAAENILATLRGEPLKDYRFDPLGAFGAIGHYQAVANVKGKEFTGFFAWLLYRSAYLFKMPTMGRKLRLGADWFLDFFGRPGPVQLGIQRFTPHTIEDAPVPPGDAEPAYPGRASLL